MGCLVLPERAGLPLHLVIAIPQVPFRLVLHAAEPELASLPAQPLAVAFAVPRPGVVLSRRPPRQHVLDRSKPAGLRGHDQGPSGLPLADSQARRSIRSAGLTAATEGSQTGPAPTSESCRQNPLDGGQYPLTLRTIIGMS